MVLQAAWLMSPLRAAVRVAWCTALLGECITKITVSLRRLVSSL